MNRSAMTLVLVLGVAASLVAHAQTIYRSTNAQGQVVFTDDPARGGEAVELKPLTVVPSRGEEGVPLRAGEDASVVGGEESEGPGRPFMPYDRFRILAPAHEDTLPTGAAGNVEVELAIEPPLREDHRVRLLLDGQVSQSALHTEAFLLTNLERGEHVLRAELLDAEGEVRHRTEPVTLYVQRASVNLPRNPNNPTD